MTPGLTAGAHSDHGLPLVTVVTPTYNRRTMLAATLASVALQDYPCVEHIVVDGGSSDGTVDLLRRAERRWGIRWISGNDGGMYEGINLGLSMAKGSIVSWVNSDDWLMPWTVSTVVSEMQRRPYPHAVFGDFFSIAPGESNARVQLYGQFSRRGLASVETLAQPTVYWPIAAARTIGALNTDTYRQIADCEYWLRLSEVLPFFKIREFLALGQNHPGTKRESLAEQIADEFTQLRAQYTVPRSFRKLERSLSIMRWRREWGCLLMARGWSNTRHSRLVHFPWQGDKLSRTVLRFGPQRRYPPDAVRVSVAPLIQKLGEVGAELDSGRADTERPARGRRG